MRPWALPLRRLLCSAASGGPDAVKDQANKKKNVVFLGSPQVSASVLDALFDASEGSNAKFKVAAIVTQPPAARDRGRKLMPSPVAQHAVDRGFPEGLIFTPERVGEENFLSNLRALSPDLCVTAAYGNIMPTKFLELAPYGTVNIHPSLLPLYRGAAPVQRALQDGVTETGVSLAYTVLALDSGPVIGTERVAIDDCIKAPELLALLFNIGSRLLIHELPSILDGSARLRAQPQDDSKATLAPKLKVEESWLSFVQEAKEIHNKVRAFAGWPGTRARLQLIDKNGQSKIVEIKIVTTRVSSATNLQGDEDEIMFTGSVLLIPCAGKSWLEVLELQIAGKKVMSARDFWNGLRGQKLKKLLQEALA